MQSESEWELCKENIKPLKQGRDMAKLQSAVEPDQLYQRQIVQEQQKYEGMIRTYAGDDPLGVWYQYIEWIEQNYPKGGKTTRLGSLLFDCVSKFKGDCRYKNDSRFVNIFLKLASVARVPIDIYQYMYAEKIGCKSAMYFKCWANHLESVGNFKDADSVITEGLLMNAEPKDELLLEQKHLTARVGHHVKKDVLDEPEPQRQVFGALKPYGEKYKVGVTRTGAARLKENEFQELGGKCVNPPAQTKFVPFHDANLMQSKGINVSSDVKAQLVVGDNQENEMKPGKWTKAKVSMKSEQHTVQSKFAVHIDPDALRKTTPNSVAVLDKAGLSDCKSSRLESNKFALTNNKMDNEKGIKQVFMYCKDKLECGTTEFQFEELRALKYKRRLIDNERRGPPIENTLSKNDMQFKQKSGEVSLCKNNSSSMNSSPQLGSQIKEQIFKKPSISDNVRKCLNNKSLFDGNEISTTNVDETKNNPQVTSSFLNLLWNGTVADPILEFIKEESHLLKEPNCTNNEIIHTEKPKFKIFHDDELPSIAPPVPKPHFNEVDNWQDDKHKRNNPSEDDCIQLNGIKNSTLLLTENFDNDVWPDTRPLNASISMTWPSNTVFLKNIPISSTPSKTNKPLELKQINDQLATIDIAQKLNKVDEEQNCAPASYILRRSSMQGFTNTVGLSPINETSREYRSSSSSGMSSGATVSQGRSRFFRSKTLHEISSLTTEKTPGASAHKFCVADPFDQNVISVALENLSPPLYQRQGYSTCYQPLPALKDNTCVQLGNDNYEIQIMCGSGSFAKVYLAIPLDEDSIQYKHRRAVALKVQTPACLWEYYIAQEMVSRIQCLNASYNVLPSIMSIPKFYHFKNGSIIATDFNAHGTLLDVVNVYRKHRMLMPECIVIYFTIEILSIIEQIHACRIIHADIKPDNFLLMKVPSMNSHPNRSEFHEIFGNATMAIKLIDYGSSIDLTMYPANVIFTQPVKTSGFVCPAMIENKPWTFQADFFGVAASIHTMLFGEYMKIVKCDLKWAITNKFKRYWNVDVWEPILDCLINIQDCEQQPNIPFMLSALKGCFTNKKTKDEVQVKLRELKAFLAD